MILAQDLFGLWGDELRPTCTAALLAARKWAGDEVAPVSLLVYLRDSVPAAALLMVRVTPRSHKTRESGRQMSHKTEKRPRNLEPRDHTQTRLCNPAYSVCCKQAI